MQAIFGINLFGVMSFELIYLLEYRKKFTVMKELLNLRNIISALKNFRHFHGIWHIYNLFTMHAIKINGNLILEMLFVPKRMPHFVLNTWCCIKRFQST